MGRQINRLSARKVQALTKPGRHADGAGLYLVIDASGAKRWVMLYRFGGRRREMGLGAALSVPLARARELADQARQAIASGVDPIEARRTPPDTVPPDRVAFRAVAETYMADREKAWRNAAHRRQWRQTLEVQAAGLWDAPVAGIDTDAVLAVLRPIWHAKPETARRLRGRIERILDAARVAGHRSGENPARWRGHLEVLLPRPARLTRGHHAAMPYRQAPAFMAALRGRPARAARALEFLILTAARSGEVRGMVWEEVDLEEKLWTVPRERMKGGRIHRVPLSAPAVELLRAVRPSEPDPGALVFPTGLSTAMSDAVFGALLGRMQRGAFTAHGFRSSFRDWAADETDHPREVIEAALAHLVGDETERAYRRGDALAKRRHLMDDWAGFLGSTAGADARKSSRSE